MCGVTGSWRLGVRDSHREARACGEQRAAQRGPHSRPCSWRPAHMLWTRSGPAPASTDLHLCWLTSGHCLTGSLRPARHCTAPALCARPSGCRGQGGALSQAPLCGPPRGRDWEENCLGHCRGLPPPGRGRCPAWVAAATCTHSWIWTPGGGNMHCQSPAPAWLTGQWLGLSGAPQAAACGSNA